MAEKMNSDFTWTEFYGELADKLLLYKDRRTELMQLLEESYNTFEDGIPKYPFEPEKNVKDIDPFTFFACFNNNISNPKRTLLLTELAKKMEMKNSPPTNFDGIPVQNGQSFWFFSSDREQDDIDNLWRLFEISLQFADAPTKEIQNEFISSFDIVEKQKKVKWNITYALFWIRPNSFLPLDGNTRKLLGTQYPERFIKGTFSNNPPTGQEYLDMIGWMQEKLTEPNSVYRTFKDVSYAAYLSIEPGDVQYWLYSPGRNASAWKKFSATDTMGVALDKLGDLLKYNSPKEISDALIEQYDYSETELVSKYLYEFSKEIKSGDVVFARSGQKEIIGKGIVKSDYYFDDNRIDAYKNIHDVEWIIKGVWPFELDHLPTIMKITDKKYIKTLENLVSFSEPDKKIIELSKRLQKSHNIILTGAPGTGKTYLAKQIAREMIGIDSDFDSKVEFVQFHPSYDYTDFVEGLRPVTSDNNGIAFELKSGIFKEFCERARKTLSRSMDMVAEYAQVWRVSQSATTDVNFQRESYNEKKLRIDYTNSIRTDSDLEKLKNDPDKSIASRFVNEIFVDDIVVIPMPNNRASFIARVTSDAKWDDGIAGTYQTYREFEPLTEFHPEGIEITGKSSNRWSNAGVHRIQGLSVSGIGEIVDRAENNTSIDSTDSRKFVFIIDEINRGEISKIFGELFFSIDPGYRGKEGAVSTQYSNMYDIEQKFYVPENVYIIGTMNDIDRSVDTFDFAMRRRFTWIEVSAKDSQKMFDDNIDSEIIDELVERMDNLNNAIIDSTIGGLNKNYQIGGAYFLKLKELDNDFDELWKYHMEPLLHSYFQGDSDADEKVKKLHDAYLSGNIENA